MVAAAFPVTQFPGEPALDPPEAPLGSISASQFSVPSGMDANALWQRLLARTFSEMQPSLSQVPGGTELCPTLR